MDTSIEQFITVLPLLFIVSVNLAVTIAMVTVYVVMLIFALKWDPKINRNATVWQWLNLALRVAYNIIWFALTGFFWLILTYVGTEKQKEKLAFAITRFFRRGWYDQLRETAQYHYMNVKAQMIEDELNHRSNGGDWFDD